ncbi:hypothetical protein BZA05DRAFT_215850 [Tricharina praecox]|uniref:uncharacterized protein n=1 Tax=Tricharina praecox TaxID=43433 RepID=UPI00221FD221|nr:uncharacterized protein BZA05DRAFT_215850 [Tricharina praecox]KAI5855695.1 hypothetical protein BZA05DRAFT_215850 [Tricharina praecox]
MGAHNYAPKRQQPMEHACFSPDWEGRWARRTQYSNEELISLRVSGLHQAVWRHAGTGTTYIQPTELGGADDGWRMCVCGDSHRREELAVAVVHTACPTERFWPSLLAFLHFLPFSPVRSVVLLGPFSVVLFFVSFLEGNFVLGTFLTTSSVHRLERTSERISSTLYSHHLPFAPSQRHLPFFLAAPAFLPFFCSCHIRVFPCLRASSPRVALSPQPPPKHLSFQYFPPPWPCRDSSVLFSSCSVVEPPNLPSFRTR